MLKLIGHTNQPWDSEPCVLRVTDNPSIPSLLRSKHALRLSSSKETTSEGYGAYLAEGLGAEGVSILPESLHHIGPGDILRVVPRTGEIAVLYRRNSKSNVIFLTSQCNCDCLICPQPPSRHDDSYLVDAYATAIPLMSQDTQELVITGGEPTLKPDALLRIIRLCRNFLPRTALLLLSNGRMFYYMSLCRALQEVQHANLVIGLPMYSDIASAHDAIVNARGAYDQTVRGIMNLKRHGQRIEIRTVLVKPVIERLPQLAAFIARNLPFVEHVALMGAEPLGNCAKHQSELLADPLDYQPQLIQAVRELAFHRINVSIFNHQLCVLPEELRGFAKQSISDWKVEFLPQCKTCAQQEQCCGFFFSGMTKASRGIGPLTERE